VIVRVLGTGRDGAGLTRYLFGPGKANEHTNPHLVAGSPELQAEWGDAHLSMKQATYLGRLLESSWRRQYAPELALAGVAGRGGISRDNLTDGPDALAGQKHIQHVTLSLPADQKALADEQWAEVATSYMRGMGYIDNPDHSDVTWFAQRHGESAKGNDHIHIAMCTVLRDGSSIDLHNSGIQAQRVRREVLEKLSYVQPLHDAQHRSNTPTLKSVTAAEHNIARKRAQQGTGSDEPDRVQLQRIVRAAATQSHTEAEFLNTVLSHPGVRIEPARWQPGTRDQVTGYRVGMKDGIAFPASKLASDLTLSKLRPYWTETPASRELARQLWVGDASKLDPLQPTADVPAQLEQAVGQLEQFNQALEHLDPADTTAWSQATTHLAGLATVISTGRPVEFQHAGGRVADVLARQALEDSWASTREAAPVPVDVRTAGREPHVRWGLSGAEVATRHVQLALRAAHTDRHVGWLAVIQQITRAATAIADAKQDRGELVGARSLVAAAATFGAFPRGLLSSSPSGDVGGEISAAARRALHVAEHGHGLNRSTGPQQPRPNPVAAPSADDEQRRRMRRGR
jgi:hypothetical protein